MLDLVKVKNQCSIDDDITEHDQQLTLYLSAAKRAVENYLNRPVYWTQEEVPQDPELVPENAFVAREDSELAVLLLIGHWFAHREAVTESSVKTLPLGVSFLLDFDRDINL
ncbi:head-tail connector protein [Vibrio alginolyticus]|uniref:head-tail connector protein n=1 Tax=Vibrio alginolyticus TaxID=663 RepID=UPI001BD4FBDF|nr:head-tail connector protein [Vibrio alginolyticus]MBS9912013.1 phage gp6-like head-tail connector protein [Vibrio alginolyticus]MBT0049757.1 phage gp6-like head-tail connector protein [Vibrio alginolyticus]MBT0063629.1 phage gp6-like head-tail connector protein [Vibrio alginolyticus]